VVWIAEKKATPNVTPKFWDNKIGIM
jgi:hypothetical protein